MSDREQPEPGAPPLPPTPASTPRPSPAADDKRPVPWRLVLVGLFVIYAVIFVILNADRVDVSFVFFTTRVSLVVALVLALLIGFFVGYLFDAMRDRKRRQKDE